MKFLMELGPRGRGTKSRAITISLSPQSGGYKSALKNEIIIPAIPHRWGGQLLQMTGLLIKSQELVKTLIENQGSV